MNEQPASHEIRLRLLAGFLALGCGVAAAVVVLVLLHTVLR